MSLSQKTGLLRKVSLPLLIFYGIGTILGAGIYVLVGKVAGNAGMQTPFAFLLAAMLAGITAFCYAELSVRYPLSAGEAVYIEHGFRVRTLSIIVGCLIVCVGITSTATLLNGFIGYLNEFTILPQWLVISCALLILTSIVIWGIGESVYFASLLTVVEILGLLIIIWVARDSITLIPEKSNELLKLNELVIWNGILIGAFVAFYAFIGFEDMVNIAEEIKDPSRNLPIGIISALVITSTFYVIIALISVLTVEPKELAQSDAPLAFIYELKTGNQPILISLISIASILNGALVQIVMASRVLYGMANNNWIPGIFARVNAKTHTPIQATIFVSILILMFALLLPILSLAKLTSSITLVIFALINLALWRIKSTQSVKAKFSVPMALPILGAISCSVFLIYQLINLLI